MRLAILMALSALAFAGGALAQPITDHPSGVSGDPAPPHFDSDFGWSHRHRAEVLAVRKEARLACAADREALCQGKSNIDARRCIWLHRSRVSASCNHAITGEMLARHGRL